MNARVSVRTVQTCESWRRINHLVFGLDLAASRVTPVHGSQRSEPACPAPASTPVSTKKRSKKKAHAAPAPLNDKDVKRKSLEEIMREGASSSTQAVC